MNEKLWWYVARAGGLTAWWLVAAAVLWGLALSTRVTNSKPTPAWLLDLHRFLGVLSVVFTGVHIGGLVADSWTHFGWSEVFVPMTSRWRPGAVAWGVVGFYVLLAVEVSSLLMRRIPRRYWRAIHSTSLALFLLASVHAFAAGTESRNVAVQWSALLMSGAFVFLVVYRQMAPRRAGRASGTRPRPGVPGRAEPVGVGSDA